MSELVSQGLDLVILGMGTVFIFLSLLVVATLVMSRLVGQGGRDGGASGPSEGEEAALLAAVAAAVKAFRGRHRGQ